MVINKIIKFKNSVPSYKLEYCGRRVFNTTSGKITKNRPVSANSRSTKFGGYNKTNRPIGSKPRGRWSPRNRNKPVNQPVVRGKDGRPVIVIKRWLRPRWHPYKLMHKRFFRKSKKFWHRKKKEWRFSFTRIQKWYWRRKRAQKSKRKVYNFFYLFARSFSRRPWKYHKRYREDTFFSNVTSVRAGKLYGVGYLRAASNLYRARRRRKRHKILNLLKHMLMRYYRVGRKKHLRVIVGFLQKKRNKLNSLFFFFEGQINTVAVRFSFFWTIGMATHWIPWGVLSINNIVILWPRFRVRLNDYVKVFAPRILFRKRLVQIHMMERVHFKRYWAVNYAEVRYSTFSGIILRIPFKRREIRMRMSQKKLKWVKVKTFGYLASSFY